MKAGFYKIIDRQGYRLKHEANGGFLKRYGDVFEVHSNGTHVNNPAGAIVIMTVELRFFEYLGTTLPVNKPTPVYRLDKRTPKAGEVWTSFGAYGEQQFYNIHRITGPVGARKVAFTRLGSKKVCTMGMSKFCRQPTAVFQGRIQYRIFSH